MSETKQANIGMVGLAVMGRNLALNIADHGFRVGVWNLEQPVTDKFVAENGSDKFVGTKSLAELVSVLERPRRLWVMIKAGKPVDEVLEQLKPLLQPGDTVIDGGNTHFQETRRREADLKKLGLNFVGMGVSGGEEGARRGPSLMPGGATDAWKSLKPILEAIAAKTDSGPCVTHCGPDGAGHFVKMVHNGIEYGDMQLIAETYDLLHRGVGLSSPEIGDIFARWNEGPLSSFLIELTAKVLKVKDQETGKPLVELVQDKAGQKGTGKWTAELALDLGVSIPTIAAALDGRGLSSLKDERVAAEKKIRGVTSAAGGDDRKGLVDAVHDALLASKICSYAQGLQLISAGSKQYNWNVDLKEIARIWKGGCIIRARLLDTIMRSIERTPNLPNLLVVDEFEALMHGAQPGWRRSIIAAVSMGIPTPAMSASLAYFDSYRTARLPQNITQAQRDAFGAHTYERTDKPQGGFIHTDWLK
ncbi:MAG TPA: NADP-dependent phosphogluconate dehydrogenase [Polyangia bacterium]